MTEVKQQRAVALPEHKSSVPEVPNDNPLSVTMYPDVAERVQQALMERGRVLITTADNFASEDGVLYINEVSPIYDIEVTVRKILDKWQLIGCEESRREAFDSENDALRREQVLRPVLPFTHNAPRGRHDTEPTYGRIKKGAYVPAGTEVQVGDISIVLPETGFENPFKAEIALYEEPEQGVFEGLWRGLVNLRYPEVLSGKQAARTPEDPRNQFDSMYQGSANMYVCVFDRINEMHEEVYGGPIPLLDLEQLRERWGFPDLHVPNMSTKSRNKLDNHRISAAGEVDLPIRVNWIDVESLT